MDPLAAASTPAPPAAAPAPPAQAAAVSVPPAPAPAPHAPATVADVVAATHVRAKRRRAGLAPPPTAPAAAAPAPATAAAPATVQPAKKSRPKVSSRGPRGASSKASGASLKRKKVTARKKPAPPVVAIAEPPPAAHEVFEEMANPTSFMDLLQDAEVDLGAPPLEPFGEEVGEDEEDVGDDEEEVAEIGEEAFTAASRPHARSSNYNKAGRYPLGSCLGICGDGCNHRHRSNRYRSLQGRWDLMKPACARWSAAMDQVRDASPSGTVESDYETIAGVRYKEMAPSKGKPFPFKHAWAILQTFDKWKLRDQETAPKKSAMLRMDDSEDEQKERNLGKPEGTKKGKQRVKMEGEASSLREKMEQMMKAREELTRKTLETKILITEKKKEVKLAQVEAKREEAKCKSDLEERMIKVKEAKVWKELMVEEKEHMTMYKKDMDEEQLQWWKDYKEDIAERKRIFRGASSTFCGGGDGGVDDSNGGA
ncbi:DNA mismatch repair protein Msh6-1 [Hordeum vulgare]|nr:DNA mismatch repair protein Msh6-1 [Hordeum vulgare]